MYFATFYGPKCIYDVVANTFTAWHIAAYIQVMLKHPKCNFQMYRANVGLRPNMKLVRIMSPNILPRFPACHNHRNEL